MGEQSGFELPDRTFQRKGSGSRVQIHSAPPSSSPFSDITENRPKSACSAPEFRSQARFLRSKRTSYTSGVAEPSIAGLNLPLREKNNWLLVRRLPASVAWEWYDGDTA